MGLEAQGKITMEILGKRRAGVYVFLVIFVFSLASARGEEVFFDKVLDFYQKYISPLDMSECPSYPRCSEYVRSVVRKHGFWVGWIMTVDRLLHEGEEELKVSKSVIVDGKLKILDPPENNDFWWCHDEAP